MLTPTLLRMEMMAPNGCGSMLQLANLFPMLPRCPKLFEGGNTRRTKLACFRSRWQSSSKNNRRSTQMLEPALFFFGEREDRDEALL